MCDFAIDALSHPFMSNSPSQGRGTWSFWFFCFFCFLRNKWERWVADLTSTELWLGLSEIDVCIWVMRRIPINMIVKLLNLPPHLWKPMFTYPPWHYHEWTGVIRTLQASYLPRSTRNIFDMVCFKRIKILKRGKTTSWEGKTCAQDSPWLQCCISRPARHFQISGSTVSCVRLASVLYSYLMKHFQWNILIKISFAHWHQKRHNLPTVKYHWRKQYAVGCSSAFIFEPRWEPTPGPHAVSNCSHAPRAQPGVWCVKNTKISVPQIQNSLPGFRWIFWHLTSKSVMELGIKINLNQDCFRTSVSESICYCFPHGFHSLSTGSSFPYGQHSGDLCAVQAVWGNPLIVQRRCRLRELNSVSFGISG